MKRFFTPRDVRKIFGISYRQIQYWDKTNFIRPSFKRREKYRLYTFPDLILMFIATMLRLENVSIQQLRRMLKAVPEILQDMKVPLSDVIFLIHNGKDIMGVGGQISLPKNPAQDFKQLAVAELVTRVNIQWPEGEEIFTDEAAA